MVTWGTAKNSGFGCVGLCVHVWGQRGDLCTHYSMCQGRICMAVVPFSAQRASGANSIP